MYTVTNEYETYVKSEARNYSMTGSIVNKNNVTMQITRDNILEGSLSFTNRCTANNSFDIGGCCIGSMEITLQGDYHHSLYNAVITLQQGVYVTGDSYHMEKVGTWIIKKAHWNGEWVTLECYDAMCLTQKKYTLTTGSFTPYSFFTAMCNDCGITLATTQAEIEAMVNGTATLIFNGSTQETDRKWSDLIHDMCAVICGFCSINRFGNLEVHQFGRCYKRVGTEKTYYTTAVDTLTKNDRITGGTFGNGAINITGLYINDRASKNADKSILVGNTTGTTLNLGYNRWLSSATSGYATMLQNILTQLTACQFYAADVHLADVSLYDLGDLITLQAGGELSLSEDILMCVMNIDYNFADESTISSYTFSEASDSSTSAVETNLTNRIETLESSGSGSATNIIYDNTTSGLTASNVQSAIDEIAQDFQDGCDTISQAVIAKGQTPASNSPTDIAYAISRIPTDYPRLQKVYSAYTDPIDVTYITDTGQYFVIAVMTSKPGVTTSSTDIVYFNGETTGRQTAFYIINCKAGDTISIKLNNFSGNAYRGTTACILKNVGATVTSAVQDWKVFKFDTTATMGKVLSLDTIYLCVGGSCGEQHSSSFDVTANLGSYYNSNCQESGINVSVINALSGTVNISQSQFGNIAGGATVSGYILTVKEIEAI